MKRTRIALSLGLAVFFSSVALATTFVNRPLGDVVQETAHIVRGRAGDSYSDWSRDSRKILYTYTNFTITEVIKGDLKETKIVLRQPGGAKDGTEMRVPGTAHFATDEDVVVMLGQRNQEDESYDVPGFATGKYNVTKNDNGELVLVNSMGGGAMYDPNKDSKALSYNATLPLDVLRKIAKGEDIPQARETQFERSAKPAAKGSYESEHDHAHAPAPKPVTPIATPTATETPQVDSSNSEERSGLWIPISFAILALLGGFAFWKLSRGGDQR